MKTKILFVMPSLGSGGAEKSFISLLSVLPRNDFDIDVMIVNEGGLFYSSVPKDLNRIDAPKNLKIALGSIHSSYIKNECNFIDKVHKVYSNIIVRLQRRTTDYDVGQLTWRIWKNKIPTLQSEYDVAVSFMNGMTNYYVIDKVNAKRKILWVHNDYNKLSANAKFDTRYFDFANNVVTISEVCVKALERNFPMIAKGKFMCLENISSAKIINTMANEFYPKEYNKADPETTKLLSIGRLSSQKGFDLAIDAALILKKYNLKFKWYIIGKGELENELQTRINRLELHNEVLLLGERANPYPYIKNCDLVLQTSRFEGKSIVLDEAKILHKPIIVTNYPSVSDNIENNKTGIICEMSDTSIANAIMSLVNNSKMKDFLTLSLLNDVNGNKNEINKYSKLFSNNPQ